jgi:hypothetical protein
LDFFAFVREFVDVFIGFSIFFLFDELDGLVESDGKQVKFCVFFDRGKQGFSFDVGSEAAVVGKDFFVLIGSELARQFKSS